MKNTERVYPLFQANLNIIFIKIKYIIALVKHFELKTNLYIGAYLTFCFQWIVR